VRFAGKVVVVAGGGSGTGRAAALRLGADGAHVVIVDSNAAGAAAVAEEIEARTGCGSVIGAQLDDVEQMLAAAEECRALTGRVDALVNYHWSSEWGTFEECDFDAFARIVHYNVLGPVAASKAFLPLLKEAEGASIVHLGSVDGLYGNPLAVAYSTAKGGLVPLTHIMAREFAPYGIRVNAIASCLMVQVTADQLERGDYRDPPVALSGVTDASEKPSGYPGHEYLEQLSAATPLKRFGPAEESAGTVAFLVSDDSSYVTGSVIVVDCGRTGLTPGTFPWLSASTV